MNRSLGLSGLLIVCCAFIAGCSGDGGGKKTRTGVFIDGPVEGLSYGTASQSGLTNAEGEFKYRDGETVTFSIGGIELGSAPAAEQISPFDLFDMEPITDELALRLELQSRNDVTDFDRVANIAFLLVSLDIDGNPDNGIDLTGWDSDLAGVELDFDTNLYEFADKFRRFAGEHGINSNVTPMQPLAHLYESLGIIVRTNLLTAVVVDSDNNGTDDDISEYEYDPRGLLTEFRFNAGIDEIIEQQQIFTYTPDGRIATRDLMGDYDADGNFDSTQNIEYTYNSDGDLEAASEEIGNGSTTTNSSVGVLTYNEFGDLLSLLLLMDDSDADSDPDDSLEFTSTYDEAGHLLTQVLETDSGFDTVVDRKLVAEYTYNAAGKLLTWQQDDYGNDNVVDSSSGGFNTYDTAGNLLTETFISDSDGPSGGEFDYSEITTNTYDSKGNVLTTIIEVRGDGANLSRREVVTNAYNSDGTLLMSSLREIDGDGDGDVTNITNSIYTYGTHGNWMTQRHESDTDADGTVDSVSMIEHQYRALNDGMFGLLYHYSDSSFF